jgi:hypothetical protein
VKPPWYDTSPTVVEALNPGNVISFSQVRSGETTTSAAVFRFVSCYPPQLSVKTSPSPPFSVLAMDGKATVLGSTDSIWTEARKWFSFTAGSAVPPVTVSVHCETPNYSQDFSFTLVSPL